MGQPSLAGTDRRRFGFDRSRRSSEHLRDDDCLPILEHARPQTSRELLRDADVDCGELHRIAGLHPEGWLCAAATSGAAVTGGGGDEIAADGAETVGAGVTWVRLFPAPGSPPLPSFFGSAVWRRAAAVVLRPRRFSLSNRAFTAVQRLGFPLPTCW